MDIHGVMPEEEKNPLEAYTINFTQLARERKLDPVIGRDNEIRRIMQILSRRTKNNPILLGDPGVGKTALVEGLAQRIVSADVPNILADKEIISIDLASMLAGAAYRGEFEKRLKSLLKEVEKAAGKYILFIDEIHTLVGAGAAEGAIDAANMLKPPLARGVLRAIGATTVSEYRKYIEKDQALTRRFQPVYVDEPGVEDSIAILRGIKQKYELHHGIKISDDAVIAAVELSSRYIPERYLPDKAIDLLDEAAATLKIEIDSSPYAIDELRRAIIQDEIELAALKREKAEVAKNRGEEKRKQIIEKKAALAKLEAKWEQEKKILTSLNKLREELDNLTGELEKAEREALLEKAAELKYGRIPELQKKLKKYEAEWIKIPEEERLLKEQVTEDDIARIVSRWTGIPVERMLKSERQRLLDLEKELHKRVVDQEEAIVKICRAIRRSRVGFSRQDKPIGTFLFVGPTGVGKTETAKALAFSLFNDEKALVRIDMSEYSEPHSIARLIGAPPGYVGYEEGGQLTEAIRRRPYSVILFDEIEKAHTQIFNLFLQIFADGRLTDGQGRVVNFTNTIIIMTSNIGSQEIIKQGGINKDVEKNIFSKIHSIIRPEILNRIDSIVLFNNLDKDKIKQIVQLQLKDVEQKLLNKKIKLQYDDKLVKYLMDKGFDPIFGARPLQRLINEEILDEAAYLFIEGKIAEGDTVLIDAAANKLKITKRIVN